MTVELGLIHPPVGMNVFVIKSVVQDVSFSTIFLGVLPFIITDLIRLVILIAFPILALWLPSQCDTKCDRFMRCHTKRRLPCFACSSPPQSIAFLHRPLLPPTPSRWKTNKKAVLELYEPPSTRRISRRPRNSSARATSSTIRGAADGPEGLKAFLAFLREKFPNYHSEIKRVFADGDYVILHVHNVPTPGSRGNAIIDIFKLENGKVVEHWDVRQEIPEQPANSNTMF